MMHKSSINIVNNLPSFIKEDESYENFIIFIESYYDWFDESYNLKGFESSIDIDTTLDQFTKYFTADFLPQFPKNILTDNVRLLKIARDFFASKGTLDSIYFLFKALFNVDVTITETFDFTLVASGGNWIVPKSIKIKSNNPLFLNINNKIVFGTLSKTFGTVETSKVSGEFTQIYLSNIRRLYYSGEPVVILDSNNLPLYYINDSIVSYDETPPVGSTKLESRIIGALSSIDINSDARGKYYTVGDPVIVYGGLLEGLTHGAIAEVSQVTSGGIADVEVIDGGVGYLPYPNSAITFYNGLVEEPSAKAVVSLVDYDNPVNTHIITTVIETVQGANLSNTFLVVANLYSGFANTSNINSTLDYALYFSDLTTYPIKHISVTAEGSGFTNLPTLKAASLIPVDTYKIDFQSYGILAPIKIYAAGTGYTVNDTITIANGSGLGAFANISSVGLSGEILEVKYVTHLNFEYPEGGMGYTLGSLPDISIASVSGTDANLVVTNILSTGLVTDITSYKIGEITKISMSDYGQDYFSTPNVSIRVLDITVTNIPDVIEYTFEFDYFYQGESLETATFVGKFHSYFPLTTAVSASDVIYNFRIYEYKGNLSSNNSCYMYSVNKQIDTDAFNFLSTPASIQYNNIYDTFAKKWINITYTNGIRKYGSGTARATVKFLNGLIIDPGFYLTQHSLLSESSTLQSEVFNNKSYVVSLEKSLDSYKSAIKDIIHPIGTQILFRNIISSSISQNTVVSSNISSGNILDVNSTITGDYYGFSNIIDFNTTTLVTETRRNLIANSDNFDNGTSGWTNNNGYTKFQQAYTSEYIAALISDTNNTSDLTYMEYGRNSPFSNTQYFTASAYLRKGTAANTDFYIFFTGGLTKASRVRINWVPTIPTISALAMEGPGILPVNFSLTAIPPYITAAGWYRVAFSVADLNSANATNSSVMIRIYPSSRDANSNGTIYISGTQLEFGNTVTDYQSTENNAVKYQTKLFTSTFAETLYTRRNILYNSQNFSNSFWTFNRSFIAVNTAIQPPIADVSVYKFSEDATSGSHYFDFAVFPAKNIIINTANTYTRSMFVKFIENQNKSIQFITYANPAVANNCSVTFFSNGYVQTAQTTQTIVQSYSTTQYPNNWWRFSQTFNLNTQGNTDMYMRIMFVDNSGSNSYTGNTANGIYIAAAQLEEGSDITDYQNITDGSRVDLSNFNTVFAPNSFITFTDPLNNFDPIYANTYLGNTNVNFSITSKIISSNNYSNTIILQDRVYCGVNTSWKHVSAGGTFSHFIKSDGTLWACGYNQFGTIGDGTTSTTVFSSTPKQIGSSNNWSSVSGGTYHSIAIKSDGTLWGWGYNTYGALGLGYISTSVSSPTNISNSTWKQASCKSFTTCAIKSDGTLWGWGYNIDGQLASSNTSNQLVPYKMSSNNNWKQVDVGFQHTLAITTTGKLYATGNNNFGALGIGSSILKSTDFVQVKSNIPWIYVSAGTTYHSHGIKSDGTLWGWGYNNYGQLGIGNQINSNTPMQVGNSTNWVSVSCGSQYSIGKKSDGSLWGWGRNIEGQLGTGSSVSSSSLPVLIQTAGNNWNKFSSAASHVLFLHNDGSIYSTGVPLYGRLGTGIPALQSNTPIMIDSTNTYISFSSNTITIKY